MLIDLILLAILLLDVYLLVTSRLEAAVRVSALQGLLLALTPLVVALSTGVSDHRWLHPLLLGAGTLLSKTLVIPALLQWAIRRTGARREEEPFLGLHLSTALGALVVGCAFWLQKLLPVTNSPSSLLVSVALATVLIGFLVLSTRTQAISQVVGYLTLENGVYLFGQLLTHEIPLVVELGIFLDVLVAVAVMSSVIFHINHVFKHIDTRALASLRD